MSKYSNFCLPLYLAFVTRAAAIHEAQLKEVEGGETKAIFLSVLY